MKLLLSFIFLLSSAVCFGQGTKSASGENQSFYAEVGGPGILFSANYDRRFKQSRFGFGGRVGLGFVTGYEDYARFDPTFPYPFYESRRRSVLTVPVQVNYVFGKDNSVHAFEAGLGATYIGRRINLFQSYYDESRTQNIVGTASFMYRRMPKDGGFSWRLGFTPIFATGYIQASAGASVGYNF